MISALVLVGGEIDALSTPALPGHDIVIAADSGLQWAAVVGVQPDLVVGDMDSVDVAVLDAAESAGSVVDRHATVKNHTDMELALRAAMDRGAERITVLGGGGGRLDHLLGNLTLLANCDFAAADLVAYLPPAVVTVARSRRVALRGRVGDYISLFAMGAGASGIYTSGLQYELENGQLLPGATLGVSNEFSASEAWVDVASGVVLAVQPGQQ